MKIETTMAQEEHTITLYGDDIGYQFARKRGGRRTLTRKTRPTCPLCGLDGVYRFKQGLVLLSESSDHQRENCYGERLGDAVTWYSVGLHECRENDFSPWVGGEDDG